MKKLLFFILISFMLNCSLYGKVYKESIKNKIKNYFLKNSNIIISDEQIFINNALPSFNLYEIKILNDSIRTNNSDISLLIKITDFFDKKKYKILNCKILDIFPSKNITSSLLNKKNIIIGKKVKIIYENDNIIIYDTGKIIQSLDNNIYLIKNSFNQNIKCIKIKKNLFKIIE